MKEHVYITETGERVREHDGLVEVGLSPEAQVALGRLMHFRAPEIGARVREGGHLFAVEGSLSAAEFYAPVEGAVIGYKGSDAHIFDWLVTIRTPLRF